MRTQEPACWLRVFGLLGPNGAGKRRFRRNLLAEDAYGVFETTFINVLVGLAKKSGGEARVFGHDVEREYRAARDRIGLSPQEFNVDRFFPIREVLVHKAGYHGVGRGEARDRAEEALRTVGLWGKRDTRFHWLSGGMKRRFMLARAVVTRSFPEGKLLERRTFGAS